MSNIFGPSAQCVSVKKDIINEEALLEILTNESSKSFFCETINGKLTVTNESVKTFVIDSLYNIISTKISKLDAEYQEIGKSKGDYKRYAHFTSIDETVKALSDLVKEQSSAISPDAQYHLNTIFKAHDNLVKHAKEFKDAFTYDIAAIKQYYIVVIASIIYATGFIVSTMIDYERRNAQIAYDIIFKNVNTLERGLPKNMMATLSQFNSDIRDNKVFKTVNVLKNQKPKAAIRREDASYEDFGTGVAVVTAGIIALAVLLPLIRHAVYFFLHTKLRLSEYFEQQAAFLELNIRALKLKNTDSKIIKKQEKAVKTLYEFAAKLSGDKYETEKAVNSEISKEDKEIVSDADKKAREDEDSVQPDFDESDIML
jgi:hypothetical protein